MTAARAFYDAQHQFTGVVTVDMVLPQLRDFILAANVNPNETIYVITAQGAIFVHPNEAALIADAQKRGMKPTSILDLKETDLANYNHAAGISRTQATATVARVGWGVHVASDDAFLFNSTDRLRTTSRIIIASKWDSGR